MKLKICLMGLLCLVFRVSAQNYIEDTGLKVGDKVPDLTIRNVLNYPGSVVRLSDLKGKLIVLDFWATWCEPCVQHMQLFCELQQKYAGRLQLLLVDSKLTRDDNKRVTRFFDQRKPFKVLASAVGDTVLTKLFPYQAMSHSVWIMDNKVVALTDADHFTEASLRDYFDHGIAPETEKNLVYDFTRPLFLDGNGGNKADYVFRSFLAGYAPGLGCTSAIIFDDNNLVSRVTITNEPVLNLYLLAYPQYGSIKPDRILIRTDTPTNYSLDSVSVNWLTHHAYNYEAVFPRCSKDQALDYVKNDLRRYFNLSVDTMVSDTDCYVLKVADSRAVILNHTGGDMESNFYERSGEPVYFKDAELNYIVNAFENRFRVPVINETGLTGRIDLSLSAAFNDPTQLAAALKNSGFVLVPAKRKVTYLVLSNHKR